MRVLHVIQRYPPAIGGSEAWCGSICQFLAKKGVITEVATTDRNEVGDFFNLPSPDQQYIKLGKYDYDDAVLVKRYNYWSFAWEAPSSRIARFLLYKLKLEKIELGAIFKHSPHSFQLYRKLFNDIKPADIVHLHTLPYFHNLVAYALAKALKKKIVITPHFHPGHVHYERKIFYKIMNKCDAVFTVSNYEKEYLIKKGVGRDRIYVTGNFIEPRNDVDKEVPGDFRSNLFDKLKISGRAKIIIFIGRKEIYKGIFTLIEAAKIIANEDNMDLYLFLLGPDLPEFKKKFSSLQGLGKLKVIDFGVVSDREKRELIKISDLLVLASEFEAFGIVFLEAWEHKKPVIGSNVGAVPEIIKDAGLCVEYGNVGDLREKIKAILLDNELAARLGENGYRKLNNLYSLELIGNKVLNTYNIIKKRKKRILVVNNLFPPFVSGGAEIVAYEQSKKIKKMGFDIRIFSGKRDNLSRRYSLIKKKKYFEVSRVILHDDDFDYNYFNDSEKEELLGEFSKTLYEVSPDLVHFHNLAGLSIKMIEECKKLNIPMIMTLHDYWPICYKGTLLDDNSSVCNIKDGRCLNCKKELINMKNGPVSALTRNTLLLKYMSMVDLLISPSKYLIERFIDCGIPADKTRVINNGIDTLRFRRLNKGKSKKIRFGFIGQICEHKGVYNLLSSISLLSPKERIRVSFFIAGSGEKNLLEHYKEVIREQKIADCVNFLGRIKNNKICKFFSYIDVLIVPSVWPENSPVVIMEAFASGTPVLASRIGGIPELVEDGITGYLHRHDDPAELASNIRRIIENPGIVDKMRAACLVQAKNYDLKKQAGIIADCYHQLNNCKNS